MNYNAYSGSKEGLFGLSVQSSGHIFAEQSRRIDRPFGREDWLLFYVAKGTERFSLNGTADAHEGSFVCFRPGQPQIHFQPDAKTAEFYYVHFLAPESFSPIGFECFHLYHAKPSARIRDLFEEILHELEIKPPFYEHLAATKLLELMCELSRRIAKEQDPNRQYADRIAHVISLMNRELAIPRSLEDYAALCNLSKFHFLRVFEDITGASPVEYKNRLRIEHAKSLLEDSDQSIGEISEELGFSSSAYFCDAFKKKVGCSPSRYRTQANQRTV